MASRTLPGIGIKGYWTLGEDGWKDENDLNLLMLSALAGQRAINLLSADPGAHADGDIYLFSATHPTHPGTIAVYDNGGVVYITPVDGVEMYNTTAGARYRFKAGDWHAVALTMTQAAYDALGTHDSETLYFITA